METATDDDDKGGSSSGGFSFSPPKPPSAGGDGGDKKHKKDKKKKHKKEKGGGEADARKGPMVDAFMKAIEAQRAEAKRAKLAARLRPTVWTDWRDEFAIEWKACPLPTAHEHFCIEADSASQDQPMHRTEVASNEGFARDACAVMTRHACRVESLPQGLVHHIQKPNVLRTLHRHAMRVATSEPMLRSEPMLLRKALVTIEPIALAERAPKISIQDLALNLMARDVGWYNNSFVGLLSA